MRAQLVRHQGFTLIELLTVIAIIGILASFLVPALSRARFDARMSKARSDVRALADACEGYFAANGTYPPMGNDWVRVGTNGPLSMGPNGFTSPDGRFIFFPNEDIGSDGIGPYFFNGTTWLASVAANAAEPNYPGAYTGPDANGTEGNYRLDRNEDIGLDLAVGIVDGDGTQGNGRLDGTFYSRISATETDVQRFGMVDEWARDNTQLYHYYAGLKGGPPAITTAAVQATLESLMRSQPMYNAFVVYSVAVDGSDHGLHNFYLTTMAFDEDLGVDNYRSDPFDNGSGVADANSNNNGVTFDRSIGEANGVVDGGENDFDGDGVVDVSDGRRVFDFDDRSLRVSTNEPIYALPFEPRNGDGVLMVVRGG